MELYRNGLKLTATIGLDESRGSVNVPVRLLHNEKDEYLNYTEQIHIRYLFDNQVKEEILPTNDNGFYIPGKPLSHNGPIELAVHLINGDIELVTNELSFVVKNAPNGTTQVDPSEFTWQQLVDQYVNAKLETFADKADMNKFKDDVNANLSNQDKKITDLQTSTQRKLDSQDTKINDFKAEVNTSLSNQTTSINQTTSVQNSKITTLEGRMDTFTSLSEGSTTGDAELQDIRVGANGVTYTNAGDAVRGQYRQLNENLEDTNNAFGPSINIINDASKFINKEWIEIDGSKTSSQVWNTTDFISCYGFNLISFKLSYYVTNDKKLATVAFYDIDKHFISGVYNNLISDGEGYYDGYCIIPENARFFKCTHNNQEVYTPNVTLLNDSVNVNLEGKFTNSQVYAPTGDPAYFAGWYESDFIAVGGFNSVTYLGSGYHSDNIQLETLTFFNANADRISGVFNNISDNNDRNSEGIAPIPKEAKFMKVCYNSASGVYPKITLNVTKLKGKIWCIGDSITEGYIGSEISKINYPSIMQKTLGNEYTVMNKGVGGSQALTWWSKWKNLLFFQDKPTTIIIMLGANGGMEGTFDTDVDPYSNYNEYANTVTGCTCKLIEWLQEQAPSAEIIFMTTTYVDGTLAPNNKKEADNQNKYIYELQNRYNIPIIDVRKLMGINMKNSNGLMSSDGLHGSLKFYERLGSLVASQYLSVKWNCNL